MRLGVIKNKRVDCGVKKKISFGFDFNVKVELGCTNDGRMFGNLFSLNLASLGSVPHSSGREDVLGFSVA